VDKQQEHKLLPVECQQEDAFAGRRQQQPAFRLTALLGAWQHTFATSVSTRDNLKSFLLKEQTADDHGSMPVPNSFLSFHFFYVIDRGSLR
jgi:hypothetical protein